MRIFLSALVLFTLTLLSIPYLNGYYSVVSRLKSSHIHRRQQSKSTFFQGARKYCSKDGLWDCVVTIKGSSIALTSYPGQALLHSFGVFIIDTVLLEIIHVKHEEIQITWVNDSVKTKSILRQY